MSRQCVLILMLKYSMNGDSFLELTYTMYTLYTVPLRIMLPRPGCSLQRGVRSTPIENYGGIWRSFGVSIAMRISCGGLQA